MRAEPRRGRRIQPGDTPRRRRTATGREAEALVERALQCVLSARQEIDLIMTGDAAAATAMQRSLDEAMHSLYRVDRLTRTGTEPRGEAA